MKEVFNKEFNKVFFSTLICNTLVWYEYALYGALLHIMQNNFFAITDHYVSLMAVFGTFAVGFIMRPVGAVFFGYLGDRYGRKMSLIQSILLMSMPVFLMGLIPDYKIFGIFSSLMLIILRMIQGFALGGEVGNAVFLLESSPSKMRGLISSFEVLSAIIGAILADFIVFVIQFYVGYENFASWGWRICFFIGGFLGILGVILRSKTKESPVFIDKVKKNEILNSPVTVLMKTNKLKLLLAIGVDAIEEATLYVFLIFFGSYVSTEILNNPSMQASRIILLFMLGILTLVFAYVSDIIKNRENVIMLASILLLILAYPIFWALSQKDFFYVVLGQIFLVIVIAASLGPVSALVMEMFSSEIRCSAISISRNISSTIFGGFAPAICLFLVNLTENKAFVSVYFIAVAIIGIVSIAIIKRFKLTSFDN